MSEKLEKAYNGSYYTITGCGGCLKEWIEGYEKLLQANEIGKPIEWIAFNGKEMNEEYGLTGDNAYQDDLNFLAFPLDGLNVGKLSIFKMCMGDRWFDDIVDNNAMREAE